MKGRQRKVKKADRKENGKGGKVMILNVYFFIHSFTQRKRSAMKGNEGR